MKKVLVIGGTYFAGRVFTMLASKDHELTFINRGRYSMKSFGPDIKEYKADRTSKDSLSALDLTGHFDAVIDFCAYEPGDISNVVNGLSVTFEKYIYMSTADVYKRALSVKTESSERVYERPADEVGLYAYKKKLLEDELTVLAKEKGFSYTIMRPAFIYGPYNYAPRESLYIRSLVKGEPVFMPTDASGKFNMVYVKDAANAILKAIDSPAADNKCYNLSAPEVLDYTAFLSVMEAAGGMKAEKVIPVTVEDVISNNLPLPFPLTETESELFDGSLAAKELGLVYTPIADGMTKTFNAFRPVYENR